MKAKFIFSILLLGILGSEIKSQPCAVPTWLGARDITHNSVQFVCVSLGSDDKVLKLSLGGEEVGTYEWKGTDPYDVSGLQPSSTYTAELRAVCSEGDSSEWMSPIEFTTEPEPCAVPTWLGARDITHNSVQFVCVSLGSDDKVLKLSLGGEEVGTYEWKGTDPYDVSGLQPSSTYTAELRAVCSEGDSSEWMSPIEFTTEPEPQVSECGEPTELRSSVEDSTVTLSWLAGTGNISFLVSYRKANQDTASVIESQDSEVKLEGLEYNIAYLWNVKGICESDSSDFTQEQEFMIEDVSVEGISVDDSFVVISQGNIIHVINRDGLFMDRIQVYGVDGKMVVDQRVGSDDHISIPLMGGRMLIVRILSGEKSLTRKVFVL